MADYISLAEWSEANNLEASWVRRLAASGRIEGAKKIGKQWVIPADAEAPDDRRITSGKYVKKK